MRIMPFAGKKRRESFAEKFGNTQTPAEPSAPPLAGKTRHWTLSRS
jgi:hypothetical protein